MTLFDAIDRADFGLVWQLVQNRQGLGDVDEETGLTPLALAAQEGADEIVRTLLEANVDPNHGGELTPLEAAVLDGNQEIVQMLVNAGADVNARSGDGRTALMTAAESGDLELVDLLVQAGAHVRAKNDDGETAIDLAQVAGFADLAHDLKTFSRKRFEEEKAAVQAQIEEEERQAVERRRRERRERVEKARLERQRLGLDPEEPELEPADGETDGEEFGAGGGGAGGGESSAESERAEAAPESATAPSARRPPTTVEDLGEIKFVDFGRRQSGRPIASRPPVRRPGDASEAPSSAKRAAEPAAGADESPSATGTPSGEKTGASSASPTGDPSTSAEPATDRKSRGAAPEVAAPRTAGEARGTFDSLFSEISAPTPERKADLDKLVGMARFRALMEHDDEAGAIAMVEDGEIDLELRQRGETPLMVAAGEGAVDVVHALLRLGAAPDERAGKAGNTDGETALVKAIRRVSPGRETVIRHLAAAGADLDVQFGEGGTRPLMVAAEVDVYEPDPSSNVFGNTVRLLGELGADVDALDANGNTPWRRIKRSALGALTSSPFRRRLFQMLKVLESEGATTGSGEGR